MKPSKKKIEPQTFDQQFDGGDVTPHLELHNAKVLRPIQRINIDVPREILNQVDHEADRIGVTRTSLIKIWIAERIERLAS